MLSAQCLTDLGSKREKEKERRNATESDGECCNDAGVI